MTHYETFTFSGLPRLLKEAKTVKH